MIDVLEPYDEECLFSWIIRMGNLHGIFQLFKKEQCHYLTKLFGLPMGYVPKIFFENNIFGLVENIGLPDSDYFKDVRTVLDKMTVLPYYEAFMSEEEKDKAFYRFTHLVPRNTPENQRIPGLLFMHSLKKSSMYTLKYCPVCIKEHGIFLKREHQIFENKVCWEDQVLLKEYPYERNWDHLNFVQKLSVIAGKEEVVSVSKEDIRYAMAKMIHQIFLEGFQETKAQAKEKLGRKLIEQTLLAGKENIYEFYKIYQLFWLEKYDVLSESEIDFLLRTLFSPNPTKEISPKEYLLLIYILFGSLDEFYVSPLGKNNIKYKQYYDKHKPKLWLKARTGNTYLTTGEYAKKYDKKPKQILNYCLAGRIEGAELLGRKWFIPEDAPYPKDRRYKNVKQNTTEEKNE